jgi:hypothetical protein
MRFAQDDSALELQSFPAGSIAPSWLASTTAQLPKTAQKPR